MIPLVGHTKVIADNPSTVFFKVLEEMALIGVDSVILLRNHFSFLPLLQTTAYFTIYNVYGFTRPLQLHVGNFLFT